MDPNAQECVFDEEVELQGKDFQDFMAQVRIDYTIDKRGRVSRGSYYVTKRLAAAPFQGNRIPLSFDVDLTPFIPESTIDDILENYLY